jgi:signal transduction histidine kinase
LNRVAGIHKILNSTALIFGSLSLALSFIVLLGWYSHNSTLIQVFPSYVPMQYNTALGFMICSIGLIAMLFDRKKLGVVFGGIVAMIGTLTLVQYIFGVDLRIDQLLMEHYVTVETSHPGRMAPNTALCFGLSGLGLIIMSKMGQSKQLPLIVGLLGSLIVALSVVAFFGYISGVETAYGWGDLTRMAVHTSLGFILLGLGTFAMGWRAGTVKGNIIPGWMAFPVGIGITTIAVVQWQAIKAQGNAPFGIISSKPSLLPTVILALGLLMAVLLTLTVWLTQKLSNRARELEKEIKKREQAEKERAKLEEQLRHSQKMEAIGTLAGGIAHDFNNILGVIIGYTELMMIRSQNAGEDINKKNMDHVLKAADRAKELVKQILAFSRKDKKTKKPVLIAEIAVEVLSLLKKTLPSNIHIRTHIEDGLGPVMADSTQIHQVIMNLCANAAHAMRKNGGTLEIVLKEIDLINGVIGSIETKNTIDKNDFKGHMFQQLTVSDSGHGMDAETLTRIFEPYFTKKKIGDGTGMGLSVVHGIVKSHGGEITVYSEPGNGSSFHIFLPQTKNKAEVNKGAEAEEQIPLQGGNERVLLVDDEHKLMEMGEQLLTNLGYHVVAKASSIEALKEFRSKPERYDIVITDQTMPDMNGIQLAEQLKRIRIDIPIILVTGFSGSINEKNFKSHGIDAFLMKPIGIKELSQKIQSILTI